MQRKGLNEEYATAKVIIATVMTAVFLYAVYQLVQGNVLEALQAKVS